MSRPDAQAETTIDGFIILGHGFPAVAGYHTFGRTMAEGVVAAHRLEPRSVQAGCWRDGDATEPLGAEGLGPVPARLVVPAPPSGAQREGE